MQSMCTDFLIFFNKTTYLTFFFFWSAWEYRAERAIRKASFIVTLVRKLWEVRPCSLTVKHELLVVSVNLLAQLPECLWENAHRPRWLSPKLPSLSLATGDPCQPALPGCCYRKSWTIFDEIPSGWRWPKVPPGCDVEWMTGNCLERLLRGSNRGEHKLCLQLWNKNKYVEEN